MRRVKNENVMRVLETFAWAYAYYAFFWAFFDMTIISYIGVLYRFSDPILLYTSVGITLIDLAMTARYFIAGISYVREDPALKHALHELSPGLIGWSSIALGIFTLAIALPKLYTSLVMHRADIQLAGAWLLTLSAAGFFSIASMGKGLGLLDAIMEEAKLDSDIELKSLGLFVIAPVIASLGGIAVFHVLMKVVREHMT